MSISSSEKLFKKLSSEDLLQRYDREENFLLSRGIIIALSFVQVEDLENSFYAVVNILPDEILQIVNWFEDFYMGKRNADMTLRRTSFPPETWIVYQRTLIAKIGQIIMRKKHIVECSQSSG